ncbi:QacE family quaternary ammonium compound efflux SMR transporter [Streptomyces sp. Ru71]|uniref:DMT family transporter n=1 Tax=Streptomyces sp. Ru71 TaxID=2080746 RepID=UPI000CDE36D0|nr:SMR family transporter [Streptomyces sp. Ru71]POX48440.1 QacE family quaternary ammonium compound efflux SMR transporter [Streptomyces sp. Ru71]
MSWVFLIGAVLAEVSGTLSLRMASHDRKWFAAVLAGYLAAFALLTLALDSGLPLGVAYGVWAASGVALIAVASRALFGEPLTKVMSAGIGLIVIGVLCIELGAAH